MAHQTEIVVNGVVTEVTEFDHTAQEIDDSVDRAMLSLLAVAAAAAYDPEGSYAVGDYCTHGGKLHKCGTNIPDGEVWNAAHWTETTVAAELAKKANSMPPEKHAIVPKNGATLRAGFKNSYSKDDFGRVFCNFSLEFQSNPTSGVTLFSLPQGFTPDEAVDVDVSFFDNAGDAYSGELVVLKDGNVQLFYKIPSGRTMTNLLGFISF